MHPYNEKRLREFTSEATRESGHVLGVLDYYGFLLSGADPDCSADDLAAERRNLVVGARVLSERLWLGNRDIPLFDASAAADRVRGHIRDAVGRLSGEEFPPHPDLAKALAFLIPMLPWAHLSAADHWSRRCPPRPEFARY